MVFPIYLSNQKFKDSVDLLLLVDDNKSRYVYIKDSNRYMFYKMNNNNKKNGSARIVCSALLVKNLDKA